MKNETPKAGATRLLAKYLKNGFRAPLLHPYVDYDGTVLYYKVRLTHPKMRKVILPIHLVGKTFDFGQGDRNILYKLPALLKAKRATPIYVVEGESCADALESKGLVATTSGSATSAESVDWEALRGRKTIIWADNDKEGKAYADAVANKLLPIAASVVMIDVERLGLPLKGDSVDWLKAHPRATAETIQKLTTIPVPILATDTPAHGREIIDIVSMKDVEPEDISWLWDGRIALGKLTIISGDPGLGKSMLTTDLAARVTTGAAWPDGKPGTLGNVLLVSAEDDPADTIRPRLDAAEADVSRVSFLRCVRNSATGEERSFDLADVAPLDNLLATMTDCKLVVIDPVSAYLAGTNSHTNSDVRGFLRPLQELASKHKVAIIVVSHLNKGDGSAISRTSGSIAFVALARFAYIVAKDPDDSSRRLFISQKNNLSADLYGLAYRVVEQSKDRPRIAWEKEPVMITADEALHRESESERTDAESCEAWLASLLSNGPIFVAEVHRAALSEGYSPKQVRRAREKMKVHTDKSDFKGGWKWWLTDTLGAQDAQGAQTGPLGDKGALGTLGRSKAQNNFVTNSHPRSEKPQMSSKFPKQVRVGERKKWMA